METVKDFINHYKLYLSGDIEHSEISSETLKKILEYLGLWLLPMSENKLKIGAITFFYVVGLYYCFSGYPREMDIPEWGKFIDILAGVELSIAKTCFLYWKGYQITDLVQLMDKKNQEVKERGKNEKDIKEIRDFFYFQEMTIFVFTCGFGAVFLILIFIQVLFKDPVELVIPMSPDFGELLLGSSKTFWFVYATQCFLCPFVAVVIQLCDVMIGNLYSQFIMHLDVLNYDLRMLDETEGLSPGMVKKRFCDASKTYQSLLQLNQHCESCMRPFFINNVFATVIATTFSCVEIGIMMNVDPEQCLKPVMYFLFITFPFFYWCWLGNRIYEKSIGLAGSAFIYNEKTSTVANLKLQLLFTHMVQEPLTINAKPFFVLNFDVFVRVMKVAYQFTAVFKNFYK